MAPVPFLVSAVLCLLIAVPATAAERPLSAAPPVGAAFGVQEPIAIAYNSAGQGLLTWSDGREGDRTSTYGGRIDAEGRLVDRAGIRSLPAVVVSIGNEWVGFRGNVAFRIARDGAIEHDVELPFGPGGHRSVASNGRSMIVVNRGGTMFDAIGIMNADLTGFRSLSSPRPIVDPFAVVTDGNHYYVFGYGYEHRSPFHSPVTIVKITSAGEIVAQVETSMIGVIHDVVWSGTDLVAVTSGYHRPTAFRFRADLTSTGTPAVIMTSETSDFKTLVSGANGRTIAVWTDGYDLHVYAADIHESSMGPALRLGTFAWPHRVFGSIRAAATPHDYVIVGPNIRTMTLPIDPELRAAATVWTAEQTLSRAAQYRFAPVRGGAADLFTFVEQDGSSSRVMMGRPGATAVTVAASTYRQFTPSIATSGRTALVTWMEDRTAEAGHAVLGTIVDLDGRPLLDEPLLLDPLVSDRSAWEGSDRFVWPAGVVWTGSLYLVSSAGLISRVLESGAVLDAEPRQVHSRAADHVTLARVGDVVVAAWMEGECLRPQMFECWPTSLHAARFTLNGEPIDATAIDLTPRHGYGLPQIAVDGDEALILAEPGVIIRFRRDGTFDPPVAPWGRAIGYRMTIASHRDGYLVAWKPSIWSTEVVVATLSRELQPSPGFVVATDSPHTQGPQAWTTATGEAAVAYMRVGAHTDFVPRLYLRTFSEPQPVRQRAVRR